MFQGKGKQNREQSGMTWFSRYTTASLTRKLTPFERKMLDNLGMDPGPYVDKKGLLGFDDDEFPDEGAKEMRSLMHNDLYHLDMNDSEKEYATNTFVWYCSDLESGSIVSMAGGTHGSHFGHDNLAGCYKGRYDNRTKICTIATTGVEENGKLLDEKTWLKKDPYIAEHLLPALRKEFPGVRTFAVFA